jgi:hypothetical protein
MKVIHNRQTALVLAIALLVPTLLCAKTGKETLVVREIVVSEGIEAGNTNSLKQVSVAFKRALNISLNKKFIPVTRELKQLIEEQSLSGGDVTLMPAKYLLKTTVTGFEDNGATNSSAGGVVITRDIVLSGTAELQKLSGEIVDSAPFSVHTNAGKIFLNGVNTSGKFGEGLLVSAANEAANQVAKYVMSELSPSDAAPLPLSPGATNSTTDISVPKFTAVSDKEEKGMQISKISAAKILAVNEKELTINWGTGMTISKSSGDVWEVLGASGKPVGKILINFVATSAAEPASGIAPGSLLRKSQ